LDAYVDIAQKNKADIYYVLGSTPRWASSRPDEQCPYGSGCAAEAVRTGHWEEYVRRVAQRYKGKISAYELWNEPFFSELKGKKGSSDFFYGGVEQMVEMARLARKVLNEVDPPSILVTPGFTGNPNQLELFLSRGGKQYIQAVAFHFYAGNTEDFARQLLEVRAIMKRQGISNLPLWNTETGIEVAPLDQALAPGEARISRVDAARRMAQFLVLGAAGGLDRYYYYAWDNERSGMFSPSGVREPAWDAYDKVKSWLFGATMRGCETSPPNGVRCEGELRGQKFLILWAGRDGTYNVRIPSGQRIVSIDRLMGPAVQEPGTGNPSSNMVLGQEPVRILLGTR
jgi:hypothetical protein